MKKLLLVLLMLIVVLPLAACDSGVGDVPEETEEVVVEETEEVVVEETEELEPILIGSIQDLSGPASEPGKANAWGAEYAVQMKTAASMAACLKSSPWTAKMTWMRALTLIANL